MEFIYDKSLSAFYKASAAVKADFTEEKLTTLIDAYKNTFQEDLIRDRINARDAISDLPLEFYNHIAESIVDNIDTFPEYWFMYDTRLGILLNEEVSSYIINKIFEDYPGTNSEYLYKGILALDNESYALALIYFKEVDHYLSSYYSAICYMELKSYPNAIKNFEQFLNGINNYFVTSEIPKEDFDPAKNPSLKQYRWGVYEALLFLYNKAQHYDLTIKSFNEASKIHSPKEAYEYFRPDSGDIHDATDFNAFIDNYLYALAKTEGYKPIVEFLENSLDFLSETDFYQKRLNDSKSGIERHKIADDLLRNVFTVKRPFNIEAFTKTQSLAREKILEDMIVEQIKYGFEVFDKTLELYQDDNIYGRQYFVRGANGFLDLLLIDRGTDTLYVVELKRGLAGVEVVDQIEKYMEALRDELDKPIKGIICLHQANPELTKLVESKKDIELFTYRFDFKKLG